MLPASYLDALILAFSTVRHFFSASFVRLQCFAHHYHLAQVEQAHVMLPASYLEASVLHRQTDNTGIYKTDISSSEAFRDL
jgi:hypothetical protein